MAKGALDGIRIVDITQFQSGTVCTMTLGFLGAEIIKVERPKVGELNRYSVTEPGIDSYSFITCNANKKSVTLDAKSPEGKEILWKLIEKSDVFIENMGPGSIERLGFGYDVVHERCPQVVYAQIKGFGTDGPWADYPAFDPIAQATGGSTSINGYPDGSPLQPGVDLADSGTRLHDGAGDRFSPLSAQDDGGRPTHRNCHAGYGHRLYPRHLGAAAEKRRAGPQNR